MAIKTIFLDRDGVINKEVNYLHQIENFKFIDGVFEACLHFQRLNYKIIIVSNQSGIARGFFKITDVYKIHKYLQSTLKKKGTKIDKILFCPFHKDGIVKKYKKLSKLRKPEIGMFNLINNIWKVDKKQSFIIGDQQSDMQFAKKSGIKGYYFNKKNLYEFIKSKKKINNI